MKNNIALIGFMATGKTAVGKALSKRLNKQFIELDREIEVKTRKSIPEIFRNEGEIRFRELEIEVIKEIAGKNNIVIACGGGVILNWINIVRLQKESEIVCLTASPETILKRALADGGTRPLLNVPDREAEMKKLLSFRQPFYERAAEITIDTSGLNIDGVVAKIIEKLENESLNK
ncbi:shikimate kinase [Chloroflexota bacterium]